MEGKDYDTLMVNNTGGNVGGAAFRISSTSSIGGINGGYISSNDGAYNMTPFGRGTINVIGTYRLVICPNTNGQPNGTATVRELNVTTVPTTFDCSTQNYTYVLTRVK